MKKTFLFLGLVVNGIQGLSTNNNQALIGQRAARYTKGLFATMAAAPIVYSTLEKLDTHFYMPVSLGIRSFVLASGFGGLTEYLKKPTVNHLSELQDRLYLGAASLMVGAMWAGVKYNTNRCWFQGWQKAGMAYLIMLTFHNRIQKL